LTYVEFRKEDKNKEHDIIIHVECGEKHSIAMNNKGVVYTWGCNNYGQLGLSDLMPKWHP